MVNEAQEKAVVSRLLDDNIKEHHRMDIWLDDNDEPQSTTYHIDPAKETEGVHPPTMKCWCKPYRDAEDPRVVIHRHKVTPGPSTDDDGKYRLVDTKVMTR